MPKILITGAAGFIGQLLAERLLSEAQYELILTDVILPSIPSRAAHPSHAQCIKADLSDASSLHSLFTTSAPLDAAVLLHGIMSSGSEADFALGMRVNLHATLAVLEELRALPAAPRVLYASSLAVYGQPLPAVIDEAVVPTPEGSYGAQKLMCEAAVSEYTRRGFIDGVSLRFPTISVRPGAPTAAASSFLSGMVREPLRGVECVIPLRDRAFRSWLCSPRTLAENLVFALGADLEAVGRDVLPPHKRVVNLPGIGVSIQDMMDALARVAGEDKLRFLREETDPATERMLRSWGVEFDNALAYKIGFQKDVSFEQAVRDYIATEGLEIA